MTSQIDLSKFNFETGDIILFNERKSIISKLIDFFTYSEFSHIGIVIKDPTFTPEPLKGLYLLESTGVKDGIDVEDNEKKIGVQLRKLDDVISLYDGDIIWRHLNCERNDEFYENINKFHSLVHNKTYDFNPIDWIKSLFDLNYGNVQKESCFFCSALVSFFYTSLKLLPKDTNWSIIRPCDFSSWKKNTRIPYVNELLDGNVNLRSQ